jgi:hypothetical protein
VSALDELVDRADLDGLLRLVETLCDARDWPELRRLRDRCRAATDTGRQLWAVAAHAEYRLALQADAAHAAAIVNVATGRFSIGPLSEVVASSHDWEQLAPHLDPGPVRALVAYERVLRGEDLRRDHTIDTSVYDLPLVLQPWEPRYPLATYEAWRGIFAPPSNLPPLRPVVLPIDEARLAGDPMTNEALAELTRPWTTESNGRADTVCVAGDALDAIAALGVPEARVSPISGAQALEIMAWTAASGGAHGRRRGMAAGRFNAWWAMASLSGLADDWPVDVDELAEAIDDLAFFAWDSAEPEMGWSFRLAVTDPERGLAWAALANDHRLD